MCVLVLCACVCVCVSVHIYIAVCGRVICECIEWKSDLIHTSGHTQFFSESIYTYKMYIHIVYVLYSVYRLQR